MRKVGTLAMLATLSMAVAMGADLEPGSRVPEVPADFKLVFEKYGVGNDLLQRGELVFRRGRGYLFLSDPALEVVRHDPGSKRLEIINLGKKQRCEVTLKKLETFRANLRDAIAAACAKREAAGGRGNEVAAAMSRDLIEPRFKVVYDDAAHELRLTNPTVEVVARGEPDDDGSRRALIVSTLDALIGLESLRDPRAIPPFVRLETLRGLTVDHRLRPAEVSYLYRLSGPPRKLRWHYRLVAELTPREIEAIARVDLLFERSVPVRFERYEPPKTR